ncbi:MAG: glycosyltransferase family 2 protein [Patescibacteria group bacterium]|nr:glycosyltransferase family 2 protein [Patescibacteria group bacterium]
MHQKISIIIPAYNEEKTIGKVIKEACKTQASEIIIVDDGSSDRTAEIVTNFRDRDKRVKLFRNRFNLGPGLARKRGLLKSKGELIIFFDADIKNVEARMFESLVNPLVKNKADLVMASFENFGRVTEFFAKPLLKYFFPELAWLKQPLSGLFAIKRKFIFPELIGKGHRIMGDFLLPAYFKGARITEVDIGEIKHKKRNNQEKSQQAFNECEGFFDFLIKNNYFDRQKYELDKIAV